jgi:hypothetical protein
MCFLFHLFWHPFSPVFASWFQLPRPWCSWRRSDCHGLPKLVELASFMCFLILVGNITAWKHLHHSELLLQRNPSRHHAPLLSCRFSVFVKWKHSISFRHETRKVPSVTLYDVKGSSFMFSLATIYPNQQIPVSPNLPTPNNALVLVLVSVFFAGNLSDLRSLPARANGKWGWNLVSLACVLAA